MSDWSIWPAICCICGFSAPRSSSSSAAGGFSASILVADYSPPPSRYLPGGTRRQERSLEMTLVERLATERRSLDSDVDQRLLQAARRELWEYEPLRATQPQLELEARHGTLRVAGRVRTQAIKEIVGYICLRL